MGNILVIEPRKLLQHATAIALFPEHEARIVENIPPAGQVTEFDAVVIDAAALREVHALPAEALVAMEAWTTPMVWVDSDSPQAPKRDRLVVVRRPVSREAMRAALAQCLAPGDKFQATEGKAAVAPRADKPAFTTPLGRPKIIELVEVVEDEPADIPRRGEKKKKK